MFEKLINTVGEIWYILDVNPTTLNWTKLTVSNVYCEYDSDPGCTVKHLMWHLLCQFFDIVWSSGTPSLPLYSINGYLIKYSLTQHFGINSQFPYPRGDYYFTRNNRIQIKNV